MPFTRSVTAAAAVLLSVSLLAAAAGPAAAQEGRPYDDKLVRLSEILGAVHYLRELCGSNDGQLWRDRMRELLEAEGSSALRRARFTKSFNLGYNSYRRTYNACTPSAQTAITKFITEGAEISDAIARLP